MSQTHYLIGLYRENAIAIESEARDPNGGNVYYVTMQITFHIPEFACTERNLHCDHYRYLGIYTRSGSCDHSDPDGAIKAYRLRKVLRLYFRLWLNEKL